MSEDLVRERTSVSSPPTSVISYQRQLRLSLSEPTALSCRVTYESWLRQNLTELRAVVSAMRQHAEPTASFLEPVRRRSTFVSASSAVRKRFSTPRRMNLFRVYCTYNDDGNLKPNEIHSYCEPDLCSHCCDFVIWATADTHVVRIASYALGPQCPAVVRLLFLHLHNIFGQLQSGPKKAIPQF